MNGICYSWFYCNCFHSNIIEPARRKDVRERKYKKRHSWVTAAYYWGRNCLGGKAPASILVLRPRPLSVPITRCGSPQSLQPTLPTRSTRSSSEAFSKNVTGKINFVYPRIDRMRITEDFGRLFQTHDARCLEHSAKVGEMFPKHIQETFRPLPTITKLFQRHPWFIKFRAVRCDGFSQNRLTRLTDRERPPKRDSAGSIHPYDVSAFAASMPSNTIELWIYVYSTICRFQSVSINASLSEK